MNRDRKNATTHKPTTEPLSDPSVIEANRRMREGWKNIAKVYDHGADREDVPDKGVHSYTPDKAERTTLHLPLDGKSKKK
jgi:hypothetical protein